MEGRVREKTLTGMFLKYIVIFCINTGLIFIGAYIVLVLLSMTGQVLPANYAEQWLNDHTEDIRMAENVNVREDVSMVYTQRTEIGCMGR